jgi:hypothetical protein
VQKRYYCIPYFSNQRIKDPRVYKAENIHRGKGCAKAARSQAACVVKQRPVSMLNLDRFGGDGRTGTSDDALEVDRQFFFLSSSIRQLDSRNSKAVVSGKGPGCHSVVCQRAGPYLTERLLFSQPDSAVTNHAPGLV